MKLNFATPMMEEPGLQPWEGAEPPWEAGKGTKFAGFAAVREKDWALPWGWAAYTCPHPHIPAVTFPILPQAM